MFFLQLDALHSAVDSGLGKLHQVLNGLVAAMVINQNSMSGQSMPAVAIVPPHIVNGSAH